MSQFDTIRNKINNSGVSVKFITQDKVIEWLFGFNFGSDKKAESNWCTISQKFSWKTVRKMVVLAHCKFVELLKTKANEYDNVSVTVIAEEFTSQTCLNCKKSKFKLWIYFIIII